MPANAAIYLPHDDVDLSELIEGARALAGDDGRAAGFELEIGGHAVTFNVLPSEELAEHLDDFVGYLKTLEEPESRRADAVLLVKHTRTVLGLVTECEFDGNDALWSCLFQIADRWDGFVFVYDSLVLANGAVVVGPLGET